MIPLGEDLGKLRALASEWKRAAAELRPGGDDPDYQLVDSQDEVLDEMSNAYDECAERLTAILDGKA